MVTYLTGDLHLPIPVLQGMKGGMVPYLIRDGHLHTYLGGYDHFHKIEEGVVIYLIGDGHLPSYLGGDDHFHII